MMVDLLLLTPGFVAKVGTNIAGVPLEPAEAVIAFIPLGLLISVVVYVLQRHATRRAAARRPPVIPTARPRDLPSES